MLIFRIDISASYDYVKRWNEFKLKCIHQDQDIIEQIKNNCELDDNRILDNNLEDTCNYMGNDDYSYLRINDIILNEVIATDSNKWTHEEMDDLINAFVITANNYVQGTYVNGYIKA